MPHDPMTIDAAACHVWRELDRDCRIAIVSLVLEFPVLPVRETSIAFVPFVLLGEGRDGREERVSYLKIVMRRCVALGFEIDVAQAITAAHLLYSFCVDGECARRDDPASAPSSLLDDWRPQRCAP